MADPWDVPASRYPPNQPLPKLDEFVKWAREKVAPMVGVALYSWDAAKLDEIKKKFVPKTAAGEMGCMKACYNVLGILYSEKVSSQLFARVYGNARQQAKDYAKQNPKALQKHIEKAHAQAAAKKPPQTLTPAMAKWMAIDLMTSPYNSSDHLFQLMAKDDLAGEKVKSPNAGVEQAIRDMTGNQPGVYFYGLAVRDIHTVTLAVERAADGSQKMYWLDQNNPGLRTEIKAGQLGATLQSVPGNPSTTNIYALRPPRGGTP